MDKDFIVLLPHEQAKLLRERLTNFLDARFPEYRIGVGGDHAGLIEEGEFRVLPILSAGLVEGGKDDAMRMRDYPPPDVMHSIGRAVTEFRSGSSGQLN